MDGGVANNTPISHAVELGATEVYVLPTGYACALAQPPRGALALALHAISLLTQRRLIDDIARHREDARLIVLPPPCPLSIQPIDFAHSDELVHRALSDARRFLDTSAAKRPPIQPRRQRQPPNGKRLVAKDPCTPARPHTQRRARRTSTRGGASD